MISMLWNTDWIGILHKPDAASVFLSLLAMALLLKKSPVNDVFAAILMAGAFFVKQTAVFAIPGTLIYLWLDRPRRSFMFLAK